MATAARRRAQAKYNSKPEQKKRRAMRNRARRNAIKSGMAHKGDGRDVEHVNGNPMDTPKRGTRNLRMGSQHHNRSYPRTRGGHKKNPRD